MKLSDYGLSRERGYLSTFELDEVTLPAQFDPIVEAAERLASLISSTHLRHFLDRLPEPQIEGWVAEAPEEQVRAAMVRYSFLVQAYVWSEPEAPAFLPANLARPMVAIADRLGQAPLLPYSG